MFEVVLHCFKEELHTDVVTQQPEKCQVQLACRKAASVCHASQRRVNDLKLIGRKVADYMCPAMYSKYCSQSQRMND
jgi:hypothetical protein